MGQKSNYMYRVMLGADIPPPKRATFHCSATLFIGNVFINPVPVHINTAVNLCACIYNIRLHSNNSTMMLSPSMLSLLLVLEHFT